MCTYIFVHVEARGQPRVSSTESLTGRECASYVSVADQQAPEILFSLPPSTGITNMCHHTQIFYVGSWGQTWVLKLHQLRCVLPSPGCVDPCPEPSHQKVLLWFLAACCNPLPVSATSHYDSNQPGSSSMVNQLVAGSFDFKAETFSLSDVHLPFPPVLSHLMISVLTK